MMDRIKKASNSVEKARKEAEKCPCLPVYHFHAPSNWMNDPNGPIFYKNEYHIFYQHNPYSTEWGTIHWGHAKSKNLVNWTHLPIALVPSVEKGEEHCFSGDCVINDGIPSIIYTSIGPKKPHKTSAEQWLAISKDDMITWEKYPNNPIMTLDLHGDLEIRDWRDPYLWREGDIWYAVLGGHVRKPNRGVALLYKSENLIDWEFIKSLIVGEKETGRNWECPNFFQIDNKWVLIVSPHDKVIYNIGDFENNNFIPSKWKILDHGLCFYAPKFSIYLG
jgi:beta-fructofuranosidase